VVRSLITVSHEPNTDVVTIAADSSDPEFAQAVANAYLTVYFESIRSQLEGTQAPLLDEIDAEIEELNAEIARVDAAMAATMIPFLDRDPIPSVEQVAPGLISE